MKELKQFLDDALKIAAWWWGKAKRLQIFLLVHCLILKQCHLTLPINFGKSWYYQWTLRFWLQQRNREKIVWKCSQSVSFFCGGLSAWNNLKIFFRNCLFCVWDIISRFCIFPGCLRVEATGKKIFKCFFTFNFFYNYIHSHCFQK